MTSTPAELRDRFRGALLGLAVGDALGFPLRGVPPEALARLDLAQDFAPRPRGRYAKGQFSDETQLALAACEAVIRDGKVEGKGFAEHLAHAYGEGVLLEPSRTVAEAAGKLVRGVPWISSGAPLGARDSSALSRALVVGLAQPDVLHRLPHEAAALTVVTHKDPACAAASAAYARAISLAFGPEPRAPEAFCEALARAAAVHDPAVAQELQHLPRLLGWDVPRALALLARVGVPGHELDADGGLSDHALPALLVAVFAALRTPGDFRGAVALALRCGGHLDCAAALTGGLVGAHLGWDAIPARLRRGVLYADHLSGVADRLLAVVAPAHARTVSALLTRRHRR